MTVIDLPILAARYEGGESAALLARDHGVSHSTIRRRLTEAGIEIRGLVAARRLVPVTDPVARYWAFVDKTNIDGCWLWTSEVDAKGYGMFWDGKKTVRSTRWGYQTFVGPIPIETPFVLHRCDTPSCNRPNHWFLGTHAENMADRNNKNRQARLAGEAHNLAKLTWPKVIEMRALREQGTLLRELSAQFGVSKAVVSKICRGELWVS